MISPTEQPGSAPRSPRALLDDVLELYGGLATSGAPLGLLDVLERTMVVLADLVQREIADADGGVSSASVRDFIDGVAARAWLREGEDGDRLPF